LAVAWSAARYHATSDDARVAPVLVVEQDVPRGRGGLKRRQRSRGEKGRGRRSRGRPRPVEAGRFGTDGPRNSAPHDRDVLCFLLEGRTPSVAPQRGLIVDGRSGVSEARPEVSLGHGPQR